jgi:cytochrome c oxidase subunit 3
VNFTFINRLKTSNILILSAITLYCVFLRYNSWLANQSIATFNDILNPSILAVATLVFLLSAATSYFAGQALKKETFSTTKSWLLLTQIIGFIFLGIVARELGYLHSLDTPFTYSSGLFGHIYYIVIYTFLAQLFLAIALMFLSYFRLEFPSNLFEAKQLTNLACRFWNMILISWIVIFFLLYLF